jgi:hypothetical protein
MFDWLLQVITGKRSSLLVNSGMGSAWFWMGRQNTNLLVNFTSPLISGSYDVCQRVCAAPVSFATHPAALSSSLLSLPPSASTSNNIPRRERTLDLILASVTNAVIAGVHTDDGVMFLAMHTLVELRFLCHRLTIVLSGFSGRKIPHSVC